MNLDNVMRDLAALGNEKMRAVNARAGDAHGVNLTQLRELAKKLKTDHALAGELWRTGDPDARLLATLMFKPKTFSVDELDALVQEINYPKLLDWFIVNVVKASRHVEELRVRWKDSASALVGRAGWSLTTDRVVKSPAGLDLPALLDQIEAEMKTAPAPKQWSMNHCLAEIGIHNPKLRARAIDIGERLEVLKDFPASPGCTPPFAPLWIAEMVRRQKAGKTRGG